MAHIYINGFKIRQNTGITRDNTINFVSGDLSTGKSFFKNAGDKSEEIKFKSILQIKQLAESVNIGRSEKTDKKIAENKLIHEAYKLLAERSKTEALTITILENEHMIKDYEKLSDDKIVRSYGQTFKGRIKELTWEYSVDGYREYSWTIIEDADFKVETKKFNTFNYKAPKVNSKTTAKSNAPSWIKSLIKCNVSKNCSKYKVKCVYYLQDLLRKDGFYLKYKRDGQWCTWTQKEFEKWQKKNKVRVTGKFDTATKNYLKKRFKL